MAAVTKLEQGMKLVGRSLKTYTVAEPLYPRQLAEGRTPYIWTAQGPSGDKVIVKKLKYDKTVGVRAFEKEVEIQQRFQGSKRIRSLVDTIEYPAGLTGMVLEYLPETLWEARNGGRFVGQPGINTLRGIMRGVLRAVDEMHEKGWTHLDITPWNILIDSKGRSEKLADLGSAWAAQPHATSQVQPLPYCSPEMLFGKHWSTKADIWSWALVYVHMLQGLGRPDIEPLYGRLDKERERGKAGDMEYRWRIRLEMFRDFRLHSIPFYQNLQEKWPPLVPNPADRPFEDILKQLGIPKREADMLVDIMKPDPNERPSAREILGSGMPNED